MHVTPNFLSAIKANCFAWQKGSIQAYTLHLITGIFHLSKASASTPQQLLVNGSIIGRNLPQGIS